VFFCIHPLDEIPPGERDHRPEPPELEQIVVQELDRRDRGLDFLAGELRVSGVYRVMSDSQASADLPGNLELERLVSTDGESSPRDRIQDLPDDRLFLERGAREPLELYALRGGRDTALVIG
jgi:hypothetical protein